jgi:signal transduction histidine kinase
MRRQEHAYGWFGLTSIAWFVWQLEQLSIDPWPFATGDGRERFDAFALLVCGACLSMFVVRIGGREGRSSEIRLWVCAAGCAIVMLATHRNWGEVREILAVACACVLMAGYVPLARIAVRAPLSQHRGLALCVAVCLAAGAHDLLASAGIVHDEMRYAVLASQLVNVGMMVALARRFAAVLTRADGFGIELANGVERARTCERVQLAHDLHDGLGGMLVGSIAELERASPVMPTDRCIAILKALRDDLRIIVESGSKADSGEQLLEDVIAPLRYRLMQLLENQEIDCEWRVSGIDDLVLPASVAVDVMRILQEGITNVMKHSGATKVEVDLRGENGEIYIVVADNGRGFAADNVESVSSVGLRSIRARVARRGGVLGMHSAGAGAALSVKIPLAPRVE